METAQDSTPHKRQELAPPSIKSYSVPNSAPMSRNISPAPPREDEPAPTTTGDEMPDFLVQTDRSK